MGTDVLVKSGEQPRKFGFGLFSASPIVTSITTNRTSLPLYKESPFSTFQAIMKGTGAGLTATVAIQCSNDDDTGRGFYGPGQNQPDYAVTTALSANLSSPGGMFEAKLVGATVVAAGVPEGTVVNSVTNANLLVMSAPATIVATGVQCRFYDQNWCATSMATITLASVGSSSDGFTTTAPWRYVRAVVTNVAGAGLTGVSVNMGV